MNTSLLNYHLATIRSAEIERAARHSRPRASATEPRRRSFAGGRTRRAALVARLIG